MARFDGVWQVGCEHGAELVGRGVAFGVIRMATGDCGGEVLRKFRDVYGFAFAGPDGFFAGSVKQAAAANESSFIADLR